MSVWYYNYPFSHGCKPPWRSAMAQGLILCLLLRAHHLTKNEDYVKLADRVANSMRRPVSDGGFLFVDENLDCWYEEYMGDFGHVLNGFIFAMIGIYEYYLFSKNVKYKKIFDKCISTLKKNLENYEVKSKLIKWTIYDLNDRDICDLFYHSLHCLLLKKLYEITNEKFLLEFYIKWSKYITYANNLRTYVYTKIINGMNLFKNVVVDI
jgi:hypothetical protein